MSVLQSSSMERSTHPFFPMTYATQSSGTGTMDRSSRVVEVSTSMGPTRCLSTRSTHSFARLREASPPVISRRAAAFLVEEFETAVGDARHLALGAPARADEERRVLGTDRHRLGGETREPVVAFAAGVARTLRWTGRGDGLGALVSDRSVVGGGMRGGWIVRRGERARAIAIATREEDRRPS